MSEERLPVAVMTGTLHICGVTLRTAVLDNGVRVINSEDVAELFAAMETGEIDDSEVMAVARFLKGLDG